MRGSPRRSICPAFEDELQDRFGPLPRPVQHLLQLARAKVLCRAIGITRVDAGPKGIALSCRESDLSSRLCEQHPRLEQKTGAYCFGEPEAPHRCPSSLICWIV